MNIFNKDVELYTIEYVRSWKSLWFRRPVRKLVFRGNINTIRKDFNGTILELVDEEHRKRQSQYMERQINPKNVEFMRPWLYELDEIK